MPDQKTMWTRCLGGFSVMWVTCGYVGMGISPVKKRIFCPKTTKFGPILAFLVILGQALPAHLVPCWWVGWWLWRVGSISQDTYLLYLFIVDFIFQWIEHCFLQLLKEFLLHLCPMTQVEGIKLLARSRSGELSFCLDFLSRWPGGGEEAQTS